jgi:23S rRNA (cytosine1962-C5)-methyltransferase
MRSVIVSRQTAGYIARGHPWVRPDRFTRGLDQCQPGEAITLTGQDGKALASALADPKCPIGARVYDKRPGRPLDVAAALQKAWERRRELTDSADTDAWRLVHGEADGLPGLRIERLGSVWVVLVQAACALAAGESAAAWLAERQPGRTVLLREHLEDLRKSEPVTRLMAGPMVEPEDVLTAREMGVSYQVTPGAGLATGLYVDQRATRAWLRNRCQGARVLNLFAYTGAFSVSLLAGGAASACDVDVAAPSLSTATANARANGVASRHRTVRADVRSFLSQDQGAYDIIICDPPTAAQGAGGGWIARRDYAGVISQCLQRLAPDGLLLACTNTRGDAGSIVGLDELLVSHGLHLLPREEQPPLGVDLPQLKGFPEGRPFRLSIGRRRLQQTARNEARGRQQT